MAKISELPEHKFIGEDINNCFYVDNMNTPKMSVVKLSSIFEEIKKRALEDEGLTVEFKGNNIIFIKGNENNLSRTIQNPTNK